MRYIENTKKSELGLRRKRRRTLLKVYFGKSKGCRTEKPLSNYVQDPWGLRSTMDSVLTSHPVALGLILSVPKNFCLDVAEIYWQHCLEKWTEAWSCQLNPSSAGLCQKVELVVLLKNIFKAINTQWSQAWINLFLYSYVNVGISARW